MINPLKQLGDLNQMRQQAMQIQKELSNEIIVVDKEGVHIEISGDQKVKVLTVNGDPNYILMDVVNESIKKSQEVAAKKLQQMSGGLGGLLGR
jgi:nucleoid-associated protein EbfC